MVISTLFNGSSYIKIILYLVTLLYLPFRHLYVKPKPIFGSVNYPDPLFLLLIYLSTLADVDIEKASTATVAVVEHYTAEKIVEKIVEILVLKIVEEKY